MAIKSDIEMQPSSVFYEKTLATGECSYRKSGIMRSLGASRGTIMQNIIVEACMITAISYLLAFIFALPLSIFIGQFIGELLMEEAFPLVVSWQSLALWWLITNIIGILASAVPAWQSARLSIGETLVFH